MEGRPGDLDLYFDVHPVHSPINFTCLHPSCSLIHVQCLLSDFTRFDPFGFSQMFGFLTHSLVWILYPVFFVPSTTVLGFCSLNSSGLVSLCSPRFRWRSFRDGIVTVPFKPILTFNIPTSSHPDLEELRISRESWRNTFLKGFTNVKCVVQERSFSQGLRLWLRSLPGSSKLPDEEWPLFVLNPLTGKVSASGLRDPETDRVPSHRIFKNGYVIKIVSKSFVRSFVTTLCS